MPCYFHIQLIHNTALHLDPAHLLIQGDSQGVSFSVRSLKCAPWCSAATAPHPSPTRLHPTFYPRGASDARVMAIIVCLCVCVSHVGIVSKG